MPQTNLLVGKRPVGTFAYIGTGVGFDDFYWSFIQLVAMSYEYFIQPGTYVHIDHSCISGQITARNELVLKMQGDWLLQFDSDHQFDPDIAFRLLQLFEANNLDVLVGYYGYKSPPHNPVLYRYVDGEYKNVTSWGTPGLDVKLLPIDAAGGGCLLVRKRVFDAIKAEFKCLPFSPEAPFTTDDFSFFEKCRKLGIKSWCAPHIECKHLSINGYGLSDYDSSSLLDTGTTTMADVMV